MALNLTDYLKSFIPPQFEDWDDWLSLRTIQDYGSNRIINDFSPCWAMNEVAIS